jgi:hypothetical protein
MTTSVTINIYDSGAPGAAPPTVTLAGPVTAVPLTRPLPASSSKGYLRTADFVVRDNRRGKLGLGTMVSTATADPIRVEGSYFDGARWSPAALNIPQPPLADFELRPSASGDLDLYFQGQKTAVSVSHHSVAPGLGGLYEIHSGVFIDSNSGIELEFVASLDPLPATAVVIIVIACIAGFACCFAVAITAALAAVQVIAAIANCIASGGVPETSVETKLTPGYDPAGKFTFGCQVTATVKCTEKKG